MDLLFPRISYTKCTSNTYQAMQRSSDRCSIKTLIIPRGVRLCNITTIDIVSNGTTIFSQPFELLTDISISAENFIVDLDIPSIPIGQCAYAQVAVYLHSSETFQYTMCMMHGYDKKRSDITTKMLIYIKPYHRGDQINKRTMGCVITAPWSISSLQILHGDYLIYNYIKECIHIHSIKRLKPVRNMFVKTYADVPGDLIDIINAFIEPMYMYWISLPPGLTSCCIVIDNRKANILYTQETNTIVAYDGCMGLQYTY